MSMIVLAVLVGGAGAAAGYFLANPPGRGTDPIVIAIQPTDDPGAIAAQADELEAFLESRSGLDVDIKVPLTYTGVVEALRFGHADVAMMSAWPSRLAHDVAGAEIVLAENREVVIDGEPSVAPYYFSYFVVLEDSPYESLEDLEGKRIAFSSATSTSGYVYPLARLIELGHVPSPSNGEAKADAFFGDVLFAGGYAQAWQALKEGQVDVAIIAGDVKAELFQEVMDGTRILETQGPIPSHAVVFRRGFDGEDANKLKEAFLELRGEHRDLMRKLVSGIFVEFVETTTEEHTAPLDEALALTGLRHQDRIG